MIYRSNFLEIDAEKEQKIRGKFVVNEVAKGYNLEGSGGDPRGKPKQN